MRSVKAPVILLIIVAFSALVIIPGIESASGVSDTDVGVVSYVDKVKINAGNSDSFKIEVVNYLGFIENDITNSRMVSIAFTSPNETTVSVAKNDGDFVLAGQEHRSIIVNVDIDRYATAGKYTINIALTVRDLNGDSETTTSPIEVQLVIMSALSSGETYNKIMGLFANPLPEPFNGPLATAIISFLLWMVIGIVAMLILIPVLTRIITKNNEESRKKIKKGLRALFPLAVLLFAFDNGLRVYGAPEDVIGPIEAWFNVIYIVVGAVIAWRLYIIFIQYMLSRIEKNNRIDQKDMDLEPLFRLLGKLVLWVLSVALTMSVLGFDLTAIITSAGIISLGITFGAQSILSQFFSGMVLLTTRPFKSGDLIRVGDSGIYRVKTVNIMNTIFENWDNEETVTMPNNAVSSSTIVNLTGDGLIYKIQVVMNIDYENDVDLAKSLMVKAAMEHPSVITNKSVDLPYTRLTAFRDSSIELRLTSYVYDFNDNGRVGGELREVIFKLFKENGISIPFPQADVHIDYASKEEAKNGHGD
ncbi:MAG: mechanosensitive ion channel [Candidatus Methanoplasma sp.]|nr:mechanosensitive ion channel [Candidatus Methanoplasma sp.]